MNKVYLLYDYEEHGPTNLVATLDPSKIDALIEEHFPEYAQYITTSSTDALQSIGEDEGAESLVRVWGGLTLEVVNLS